MSFTYQDGAGGIAEAISLARPFVGEDRMVVILGDNVIGGNIVEPARRFESQARGAKVLLKEVEEPQRLRRCGTRRRPRCALRGEAQNPPSNLAVTGIYFYDAQAFSLIEQLERSDRGELEVTDLNNAYLERGEMTHDVLDGYWADCGESIDHYLQACNLVAKHGANRIDVALGPLARQPRMQFAALVLLVPVRPRVRRNRMPQADTFPSRYNARAAVAED